MANPAQVESWSKQPDPAQAKRTHEAIREVLRGARSAIRDWSFEDFLQGSYRNDTNIRADSDVDIVVRLDSVFTHDTTRLSPFWSAEMQRAYGTATYTFADFRRDVFNTLSAAFGNDVTQENKCIKVCGRNGRLDADVVPCLQHRYYRRFSRIGDEEFDPGITFYTLRESRMVVNFPVQHYDNGVAKQAATRNMFKPLVRAMKNARNALIDAGRLNDRVAPSYFLQCLVYNASNDVFRGSVSDSYAAVVEDLINRAASWRGFVSENGIVPLFGATPEQWNETDAATLVVALRSL